MRLTFANRLIRESNHVKAGFAPASSAKAVVARILQCPVPHRRRCSARVGSMMISKCFRADFSASCATAAELALFGTTGLTGVSAFDTADVVHGYDADRRPGR